MMGIENEDDENLVIDHMGVLFSTMWEWQNCNYIDELWLVENNFHIKRLTFVNDIWSKIPNKNAQVEDDDDHDDPEWN